MTFTAICSPVSFLPFLVRDGVLLMSLFPLPCSPSLQCVMSLSYVGRLCFLLDTPHSLAPLPPLPSPMEGGSGDTVHLSLSLT